MSSERTAKSAKKSIITMTRKIKNNKAMKRIHNPKALYFRVHNHNHKF